MKYLLCPLHQAASTIRQGAADLRRCFINTPIHLFKDVMNVQLETWKKKTAALGESSGGNDQHPWK